MAYAPPTVTVAWSIHAITRGIGGITAAYHTTGSARTALPSSPTTSRSVGRTFGSLAVARRSRSVASDGVSSHPQPSTRPLVRLVIRPPWTVSRL